MTIKLLLVSVITYLFRERLLDNPTDRPVALFQGVLDLVKAPEVVVALDRETTMLAELRKLTAGMLNSYDKEPYDVGLLLQKIQIITQIEPVLFEALRDALLIELSEAELKKSCVQIVVELRQYFREHEAYAILNKYSYIAKFRPEEIKDVSKFISDLQAELEPFRAKITDTKDPAVVAEVDLANTEDVVSVFERAREKRSGSLAFRTGWQALNRALDDVGLRRGETILVTALQFKNKSGFTRDLLSHICLYNNAVSTTGKKPTILHISFEDEIETTFDYYYRKLKGNIERIKITKEDLINSDPVEKANYVMSHLTGNGFRVVFMRVNPSEWSYQEIFNKIIKLETDGCEVQALFLDYLAMIPTTGCVQGPQGVDIRDLFRRVRNFTSSRDILFVTPHQLAPDAKLLDRQSTIDFVKQVAGKGYTSGSRQIDQEIDTEICIHIEEYDSKAYQVVQVGKRRDGEVDNIKHRYFALPFDDIAGLRFDVLGLDTSVTKLGARSKQDIADGKQASFLDGDMIDF